MATLNKGTGADGNATAAASTNISTTSLIGRGYGDMVSYQCSAVGGQSCTTMATPNGIVSGDEVLLMNIRGVGTNGGTSVDNEGNYETLIVDEVNGSNITFTTSKTKLYGDDGGDLNLGNAWNNQKVILQRVPNYQNLTVDVGANLNGTDYALKYQPGYSWYTYTVTAPIGGILFFRVSETLTVNGSLGMNSTGPAGGLGGYPAHGGPWINYDGGIGHPAAGTRPGTGGSHATLGGVGAGNPAAPIYGDEGLLRPRMGSGGGGADEYRTGGRGGGIIAVFAHTAHLWGSMSAKGQSVSAAGFDDAAGGGSGGSILLQAGNLYMHGSAVYVAGGTSTAPYYPGGAGGDGRVAIYYSALLDGLSTIDVTPYVDSDLSLGFAIEGLITEEAEVLIYNPASHALITSYSGIAGAYEIGVPGDGYYDVVARTLDGQMLAYGNVQAAEIT